MVNCTEDIALGTCKYFHNYIGVKFKELPWDMHFLGVIRTWVLIAAQVRVSSEVEVAERWLSCIRRVRQESVFSTHVALWAGMTNGHLPSEECQWKERSQRNFSS